MQRRVLINEIMVAWPRLVADIAQELGNLTSPTLLALAKALLRMTMSS